MKRNAVPEKIRSMSRSLAAWIAGMLLILAGASQAPAQNYTVCYLNFDGNPSGVTLVGCPSRVFLSVDSTTFNFLIGPDDPNAPAFCGSGLVSAPATDDEICALTEQVLTSNTTLLVRRIGETGLLVRKSKGSEDVSTCTFSTDDTRLAVKAFQLRLPVLFLDLDHVVDTTPGMGDDAGGGTSQVVVRINGVDRPVAVLASDPDHIVAQKIADELRIVGYTVSRSGSAVVVRSVSGGGSVLTGGLTVGGSLSGMGIVPPQCRMVTPNTGGCGDIVTLVGAGFEPTTSVRFGGTNAVIQGIAVTPTEQQVSVEVPGLSRASYPVLVERLGFEDCAPDPFVVDRTCPGGTGVPAMGEVTLGILAAFMAVLGGALVLRRATP